MTREEPGSAMLMPLLGWRNRPGTRKQGTQGGPSGETLATSARHGGVEMICNWEFHDSTNWFSVGLEEKTERSER
jgi:hypothetical protein